MLSVVILAVGVGIAGAYNKPADVPQASVVPIVATPTVAEPTGTHIVPIGSDEEKAIIAQNNIIRTVPAPTDGSYYPKADRPAGIIIYSITFHEGYRVPGMKAVDVHIMARSNNHENELV